MVHTLRNALDHGLESAEERLSKKKSLNRTIRIKIEQADGFLTLGIEEDGRGLALDKLSENV